jgi:hypothetical protein
MRANDKNSTRARRSIANLDDRKNAASDPGSGDPHGRRMPHYKNDLLEDEEEAALDHVQVSGIGDVAEDGKVSTNDHPAKHRPSH